MICLKTNIEPGKGFAYPEFKSESTTDILRSKSAMFYQRLIIYIIEMLQGFLGIIRIFELIC